jgi:hypothetical protein
MKRSFIRTVYGDIKGKLMQFEIPRILENSFNTDFITYVWGDDNKKYLESLNVKCRMVNSNPFPYDINKYLYRPKLDVYQIAMEDDGYDEIVFLDWDMVPTKKLPSDFWEQLGHRECIQGPLYALKKRMCPWRSSGANFMIQASFLYIRDKTIPEKFIKIWNGFPDEIFWRSNDERSISKYIDDIHGGWIGADKWWDLYEPMFCHLVKKCPFGSDKISQKDICFLHRAFDKWPR